MDSRLRARMVLHGAIVITLGLLAGVPYASAIASGPPAATLPQRRLPAHVQNASASHQSVFTIGWFGFENVTVDGTNVVFHEHIEGCSDGFGALSRNAR